MTSPHRLPYLAFAGYPRKMNRLVLLDYWEQPALHAYRLDEGGRSKRARDGYDSRSPQDPERNNPAPESGRSGQEGSDEEASDKQCQTDTQSRSPRVEAQPPGALRERRQQESGYEELHQSCQPHHPEAIEYRFPTRLPLFPPWSAHDATGPGRGSNGAGS